MRKPLFRIIYAAAVFVLSIVLIELFTAHRVTATTEELSEATLPVVTMVSGSVHFNELHGFVTPRDPEEYRSVVTPISAERTLTLEIDPFGGSITSVTAEVRNISGERLIERDDLSSALSEEDGVYTAQASFGDLVTADEEYLLVLVVSTAQQEDIRYYTRISMAAGEDDQYVEAIRFATEFHENTLSADNERYINTYIETDDSRDNSSLADVDINSSYDQIVWNSMVPEEEVEPVFSLIEAENGTFILQGDFVVRISANAGTTGSSTEVQDTESHRVLCEEYYRVRSGSDRFHLLNYRRSACEIYDPGTAAFDDNTVHLGIAREEDIEAETTDDGKEAAFVLGGNLYVVRSDDSTAACVFGFADPDSTSRRDLYPEHDIRILNLDDDGGVSFLVYGYMNRGEHEGNIGTCLYYYSPSLRTLEERAFISFDGSFEILKSQIESNAYLSSSGRLYLLLEDTLYEMNTRRSTWRILESWTSGESVSSEGGQMIAFSETEAGRETGNIVLEDLADLSRSVIEAGEGETLTPLGFFGEDLIYGITGQDDAEIGMYAIVIVDKDLNVLENYRQDGYYIQEAVIDGNQITLHRVQRQEDEDGTVSYIAAADDQIVGTAEESSASGVVTMTSSDSFETVADLTVTGLSGSDVRYLKPAFLSSGRTPIELTATEGDEQGAERFYVYGLDGFDRYFYDASDAVRLAASETGTVTGRGGICVWNTTTAERAEIENIGDSDETATVYSTAGGTAACLDAILRYEGSTADVAGLLSSGESSSQILSESLEDVEVLDLTGCTMDQVLWYPSEGIPVLAYTGSGDGTVLITGYGPENIAIWDGYHGVQYLERAVAESIFSGAGNRFLTYVRTGS